MVKINVASMCKYNVQLLSGPALPTRAQRDSPQPMHADATVSLLLPAPVFSPDLLTRPFKDLMSSPQQKALALRSTAGPAYVQREHRVDPSHVWVEGIGLVCVALSAQLAQVVATAAIPTGPQLSSSLAALPQQAAAPGGTSAKAGRPTVKSVPQLRSLHDLTEFWQIWEQGDSLNKALKDPPAETYKWERQRYSEWKLATQAVEHMAAQDNREPSSMVELLESKRKTAWTGPAKFLNDLGSNWNKERRQEEAEAAQQAEDTAAK